MAPTLADQLKLAADRLDEATAALNRFSELLKTGPRAGLYRIGPGIEGLRLRTL